MLSSGSAGEYIVGQHLHTRNGLKRLIPRAWIDQITFSDGTSLRFSKSDIVLIVGPNNAGKSAALRAIRDKLSQNLRSPVISDIALAREGTPDEVVDWLDSFTRKLDAQAPDPVFQAFGVGVNGSQVSGFWQQGSAFLQNLSRFFCHLLTADERLQAANPAQSIAVVREPPVHPVHYLLRDDRLEEKLSAQFRKAFGVDLVVNRVAGSQVPLHVGPRPIPAEGQDRLSYDYVEALEQLPQLHLQGDGMRSFAGVLLYTSVGRESILLIDEPEAFLHPPQARLLGRMLVADKPELRQLFIATHSGDILRGVLDAGSASVRVVRIRRSGEVNRVRQLDNEKIAELWGDPLLRYSNILDGLFHEKVIVCEADSDARFYSAVADAIVETGGSGARRPDVMFTHCGGKDRLAVVVRALREVDVPVAVAVDFDVLNNDQPLKAIVEAAGGDWGAVQPDWNQVKAAVDSKKAELSAPEVRTEIEGILSGVSGASFPKSAKDAIQRTFRRSSPWATAKEVGKTFVPAGQSTQAYERLLATLHGWGIFVVEVGELESFARTVGNHGPKWVNEVLKKDLANDSELEPARQYVAKLLG